jgi:hypothetical protein
MGIKEMIIDAKTDVEFCSVRLKQAECNLEALESDIRNHVYESLEVAEFKLEGILCREANEACEGSYCWGEDSYSQDFIVDDKEYVATMTFEYNRHDKTYYYVDCSEFSYGPKVSY